MKIIDIQSQLPWAKSIGTRAPAEIAMAVVHHSGTPGAGDAIAHAKSFARTHIGFSWGHIAYHYLISADGTIYKCYPEHEIGAHAGDWTVNRKAIGICMDGDYTKERPTPEVVSSLWWLLDELTTRRPDLPKLVKATVKTHREVRPTPTTCPSELFQTLINAYRL